MSADAIRFLFFIAVIACYGALVIGVLVFVRWRRKTKWPFKESDKLLRGPGEGLKRRILALDEKFLYEFFGFVIAALFAWALSSFVLGALGIKGWPAFAGVIGGLLVVMVISVWRTTRLWQERANCALGWFGERVAAEKIQPLQVQGYRIFHDVPCEPGEKGFNIDHVVVGPTGVTVVEVKTRRKGNARAGYKDHEVSFDGSQLDWPWGFDRNGIDQALNEADWLRKWILRQTGMNAPVKTVLTLPGWFVHEKPSRTLRVVNPSFLPDAIRGRGEVVLTPQQIDLISRQLDERCRDVED